MKMYFEHNSQMLISIIKCKSWRIAVKISHARWDSS